MRTITDSMGRPWTVGLTLSIAHRLRAIGVDLLDPHRMDVETLIADPPRFAQALYVVVLREASARQISPEAFAEMCDGKFLDQAAEAFRQAVLGFFTWRRGRMERLWRAVKRSGNPSTSSPAWLEQTLRA